MKFKKYIASEIGAKLDSNVITGSGTEDTAVLQAVLDRAKNEDEGVWLIIDGAALISGLDVYSNTTIECLSKDCGFFLADHSDRAVIKNANEVRHGEIIDHNITLDGGTYNQNCANQKHDIPREDGSGYYNNWNLPGWVASMDPVVNMLFVGVKNLTIKNLSIRDQRTYSLFMTNWENVNIENVFIELPGRIHGQNQDGFHIFGPGKFLNMRNVGGRTSDDFIALAPDELDGKSDITDVLIDGVSLDDADQAIRMLCHKGGRLDRVTIRNVTGTYRSYGFFINPFFNTGVEKGAGYGNIVIENVNLRSTAIDYDYTAPFLFRVGGRVKALTLRNISHVSPDDNRFLVDVGLQYYLDNAEKASGTEIESLLIDGLHTVEGSGKSRDTEYIRLKDCKVKSLTIRNVEIERSDEVGRGGSLISLCDGASAESISVKNVHANGVGELIHNDGTATASSLFADSVEML